MINGRPGRGKKDSRIKFSKRLEQESLQGESWHLLVGDQKYAFGCLQCRVLGERRSSYLLIYN